MSKRLFILGAAPAGTNVARGFLEANPDGLVHIVANWLPDGQRTPKAARPTYLDAAGIQQPFGGSDPRDPRLRMYSASNPTMMQAARSENCAAVQLVELRTIIDPSSPWPSWSGLADGYRREGNLEIYTTASFDPAGLVLYWWEQLLERFADRFTFECRDLSDEELASIRAKRPPQGFDKVAVCGGYEGTKLISPESGFPILGVGVHFRGSGDLTCWMDESRPAGTSGQLHEPDCLYAISRPLYKGAGKKGGQGRVFLGGTVKPHVERLGDKDLLSVAKAIVAGCNERFGLKFRFDSLLDVTQCRRPGHVDGFRLFVSDDKTYGELLGQAGMGIVTATGSGDEMARLFS